MTPKDFDGIYREIDTLGKRFKTQEDRLLQLSLDVATLKAKAGMWGAVAGFLMGAAATIIGRLITQ